MVAISESKRPNWEEIRKAAHLLGEFSIFREDTIAYRSEIMELAYKEALRGKKLRRKKNEDERSYEPPSNDLKQEFNRAKGILERHFKDE